MIFLAAAVLVIAALHFAPAIPPAARAIAVLAGFALAIAAWRGAPALAVHEAWAWAKYANFLLSFAGVHCFGIAVFRGSLRQRLRFPLEIGVILLCLGHLLATGDGRGLVLFGGLAAIAAAHLLRGMALGLRPSPEVRGGHDLLSLLMGAAAFGVMTQLHTAVTGVPVLSLS